MSNIVKTFSMPKGQELTDLTNFCKVMADSPAYIKLGPGGVMSIILTAKEMNLPMMPCLNGGMYNFSGTVSLSAQLMQALLMRGGVEIKVIELTDNICRLQFHRKGQDPFNFYYSIDEARKAHYLGKDNWKAHQRDMLFCRAMSGGARKYAPDLLMGCYVHGELNGQDIPYEQINVPHEVSTQIEEATKQEELQEPKQIEFAKVEGFDDFVKKHGLKKKGLKADYIQAIASNSSKTEDEIINFAINNEERFESAFKKWSEANKKADPANQEEENPPEEESDL